MLAGVHAVPVTFPAVSAGNGSEGLNLTWSGCCLPLQRGRSPARRADPRWYRLAVTENRQRAIFGPAPVIAARKASQKSGEQHDPAQRAPIRPLGIKVDPAAVL